MKITRLAQNLTVTPIVKGTRTVTFDICPHCNEEIREKSTFWKEVGDTTYTFHGPCEDKGPISSFTKEDSRLAFERAFGIKSTAQTLPDPKQGQTPLTPEMFEEVGAPKPKVNTQNLQTVFRCPDLRAGDELHVGKYKNVKIRVLGFRTDENNQPTVVSEDGTESKMFNFRIAKLLPPGKSNAR